MLKYLEYSIEENVKNEDIAAVHRLASEVKMDEEEFDNMDRKGWYRRLPKMDVVLQRASLQPACVRYGRKAVMEAVNACLDDIRVQIPHMETEAELELLLDSLEENVEERLAVSEKFHYRRVINATGVILHTNLGRAPLPEEAVFRAASLMTGYGNLEYDVEKGLRGERYAHFEELICRITGAEAAVAVNNNAAAVLLMISALAGGREIIVSRGEQVEIGGKFRIPDIIAQSGALRVEVGTTNKTRITDYEEAIGENTAALLKVHTSNFRIVGFTESVGCGELAALGRKYDIPVLEDLGSGVLVDLSKYGIKKEPTVAESLASGVDLVSFSGDKLLGGPQAGIIVGKKKWIDLCRKHPLTRAVRIDKFTVAMLENIFRLYQDPEQAVKRIPVLSMLTEKQEKLRERAGRIKALLAEVPETYCLEIVNCESPVGGGALPGETLPGAGLAIKTDRNLNQLEQALRLGEVPLIPRITEDVLLLDMRTVRDDEVEEAASILKRVLV